MSRVPTYDYACRACDHRFDAVQPITAEPLDTCPACGGPLRRVIGAVGVTFKGSGFYRTDSAASPRTASAPASPPATTAPAPSAASSSGD